MGRINIYPIYIESIELIDHIREPDKIIPAKIFSYDASQTTFNGSGTNNSTGVRLSSNDLGTAKEIIMIRNISGNAPRTVEAYISTSDTDSQFFTGLGSATSNGWFGLEIKQLQVRVIGYANDFNTGLYVTAGRTYRIVVSYDGSTSNVLLQDTINGAVSTASKTMTLNTIGSYFSIGGAPNWGGNYWNGYIGQVNLYNFAVTSFDELILEPEPEP